jgi:uncharacterized protein
VLEPTGHRLRVRLMVLGTAALAVDLVLGLAGGAVLPGGNGSSAGVILGRYGTAPVVALGLLALVTEIVHARPEGGFLRRRMIDVGRMALSCYVLQNLVASALCYGWGLGLAARFAPADRIPGTVALYLLVAVLITMAAALWLRRFDRGPLELAWLWCFDRLNQLAPEQPTSKSNEDSFTLRP